MFRHLCASILLIFAGVASANTNYHCQCTEPGCNGNTNTLAITVQDQYSYLVVEGSDLVLSGVPLRSYSKVTGDTSLLLGQMFLKIEKNGATKFNDMWTCVKQ